MSAMSGVGCMFLVAGKKEMAEGSFEICKKNKKTTTLVGLYRGLRGLQLNWSTALNQIIQNQCIVPTRHACRFYPDVTLWLVTLWRLWYLEMSMLAVTMLVFWNGWIWLKLYTKNLSWTTILLDPFFKSQCDLKLATGPEKSSESQRNGHRDISTQQIWLPVLKFKNDSIVLVIGFSDEKPTHEKCELVGDAWLSDLNKSALQTLPNCQ